MTKIFVTGATGVRGRPTVSQLVAAGPGRPIDVGEQLS